MNNEYDALIIEQFRTCLQAFENANRHGHNFNLVWDLRSKIKILHTFISPKIGNENYLTKYNALERQLSEMEKKEWFVTDFNGINGTNGIVYCEILQKMFRLQVDAYSIEKSSGV